MPNIYRCSCIFAVPLCRLDHAVNRGNSPAEAADTVRAAFGGSINSIGDDHLADPKMSCATVFGGTGFLGGRVVRHLAESGTRVRIVSRHCGLGQEPEPNTSPRSHCNLILVFLSKEGLPRLVRAHLNRRQSLGSPLCSNGLVAERWI